MKKLLVLLVLLLTSCGVGFQYTALNHAGHIDGIYSSNNVVIEVPSNVQIDTLSYRQLQWKLRTDFNFRYDFAQYALSQPRSFDWNNRILGNRYNFYNPYWGYSYSWNRDMMWNDWVWGYPYSNWGWNSWGSWNRPYWGWNNSWWNGYNNWYNGPWHDPGYNVIWNRSQRNNVAYINGRRGSSNIQSRVVVNNTNRTRVVTNKPRVNISQNNIDEIAINLRNKINNKPIRIYNNPNNPNINNNLKPRINNNSKPRVYVRPNNNNNPRPVINNFTRSNNNTSIRSNPKRKN